MSRTTRNYYSRISNAIVHLNSIDITLLKEIELLY